MSPGSSSHSSRGDEAGEHLQRHVVAQARPRHAGRCASAAARRPGAGTRRRNRRAGRRRRRRSRYETITSSRRASGTKRKRRSSACAASSCRSTPCTSRRPAGRGQRRQGAPRDRPVAQRPALAARTTSRDSTSSRAASANSRRRSKPGSGSASARAHEQRLLLPVPAHERSGRKPAEQGRRPVDVHASLCDDRSMQISAPCVVSLTWRLTTRRAPRSTS